MRRLVYLAGGPGSGKSTLMRRLVQRRGWTRVPGPDRPFARDWLVDADGTVTAVELGRQRAAFSGTDALGSAVIGTVIPWLANPDAPLVLGEGARLANRRFLAAAVAAGFDTWLVALDHDDADGWRAARAARLGRTQSPTWVAGRVTATRNLAAAPPDGVHVLIGHPDQLAETVWRLL